MWNANRPATTWTSLATQPPVLRKGFSKLVQQFVPPGKSGNPFDCGGGDWHLKKPVRLKEPAAENKGQPAWFYAIGDLKRYPL